MRDDYISSRVRFQRVHIKEILAGHPAAQRGGGSGFASLFLIADVGPTPWGFIFHNHSLRLLEQTAEQVREERNKRERFGEESPLCLPLATPL